MTNAEIIMDARVFLMEQGLIKGIPGTSLTIMDEQGEREIQMPEEIRTFDEWKRMGYMVQKGQHAVARFQIWMPRKNKKAAQAEADVDKEEAAEDAEMRVKGFYKKVAFFFTVDQVKEVKT